MENNHDFDYIIVGQGLAGTLLSYFLQLENQRVLVLDFPHPGRTTAIAAGLINPVTGRRLAKSWRFGELYDFAKFTYRSLETQLGVKIWQDRNILRALHDTFEENEWMRRSSYPEFRDYLDDDPGPTEFEGKIEEPHGWGVLKSCAQVNLRLLVESWRRHLEDQGRFLTENMDYQKLEIHKTGITYRKWTARKIVFCEGSAATNNPFFRELPFLPTKGELLLVKIPGCNFVRILKHHIFLVPLAEDLYWVGSTSRYEFDGPAPTQEGAQWLLSALESTLKVPFQVIDHLAGIRPTVADVRPLLGLHALYPALGIFNGLGTKGALLGPYFAKQLADFLQGKLGLDAEVDIKRFEQAEKKGHFFQVAPK